MHITRWSTLLVAALMAGPALWHALGTHDLDPLEALTRFLIAVPVAAIMLAVLRGLAAGYRRGAGLPNRRRDDGQPAGAGPLEPDEIA
jgi:hypothetical protein